MSLSFFIVRNKTKIAVRLFTGLLILAVSSEALAHSESGVAGGLLSGLLHPVQGLDHLLAMVAVGLWGAQLDRPAIYFLPIIFPAIMAMGAVAGLLGWPLPGVEIGVSLSALVLGVVVAFRIVPPLAVAISVVGVFGIWHGFAHGVELPHAANALAYGVGFVTATGILHLCGIALGTLLRWPSGELVVRLCGGAIASMGLYFLSSSLGVIA